MAEKMSALEEFLLMRLGLHPTKAFSTELLLKLQETEKRMQEPCSCVNHSWKETSRRDWTISTYGGRPRLPSVLWTWLKCEACGADGFRRGDSSVAYCWQPCHEIVLEAIA